MGAVFDLERWRKVYPCLAPSEFWVLAETDALRGFGMYEVLAALVNSFASAVGARIPEERFQALLDVYGYTLIEIEIDGVLVAFYQLDALNFETLRAYLEDNPIIPEDPCRVFDGKWGR